MLNIVGERERPNLGFARDVQAAYITCRQRTAFLEARQIHLSPSHVCVKMCKISARKEAAHARSNGSRSRSRKTGPLPRLGWLAPARQWGHRKKLFSSSTIMYKWLPVASAIAEKKCHVVLASVLPSTYSYFFSELASGRQHLRSLVLRSLARERRQRQGAEAGGRRSRGLLSCWLAGNLLTYMTANGPDPHHLPLLTLVWSVNLH